jgi:hypothetical protein
MVLIAKLWRMINNKASSYTSRFRIGFFLKITSKGKHGQEKDDASESKPNSAKYGSGINQ